MCQFIKKSSGRYHSQDMVTGKAVTRLALKIENIKIKKEHNAVGCANYVKNHKKASKISLDYCISLMGVVH
jgi:hypothetical protein